MNSINERAKKLIFDREFANSELTMHEDHPRVIWLKNYSEYAAEQNLNVSGAISRTTLTNIFLIAPCIYSTRLKDLTPAI
jgi:hypothetical protein